MSWHARQPTLGGGVAGFHFRLSHSTMRIDGWCRTAFDVNRFVGAFTSTAKIPLTNDSERLPPPELTAEDLEMGMLHGHDVDDGDAGEDGDAGDAAGGDGGGKGETSKEVDQQQQQQKLQEKDEEKKTAATAVAVVISTPKRPPPPPGGFMFAPSPAKTYIRGGGGGVGGAAGAGAGAGNTSANNNNNPALAAMQAGGKQFGSNPSRRRICCFCGMGDPSDEVKKELAHARVNDAAKARAHNEKVERAKYSFEQQKQMQLQAHQEINSSSSSGGGGGRRGGEGGGGGSKSSSKNNSSNSVLAAAGKRHTTGGGGGSFLMALATAAVADNKHPPSLPVPLTPAPKPPVKWGLKPREIFIACPFGLVSDLACWPCLAANARSSHSEQQVCILIQLVWSWVGGLVGGG
jgi:hypothetical protein